MGRQKKVSKPKEPVRIRQRKLKNGISASISTFIQMVSENTSRCRSTSFQRKTRFQKTKQARYASGKQGEVRKNIGVAEPWHQTMGENQAGEYATADLALQI